MIKTFIQGWKEGRLIKKTQKYGKYYTHISELPLYNFFKIKDGYFEYLWVNEKDYDRPYSKYLFMAIFQEMWYQFPNLDNRYLRDKATLTDYESKYIRTSSSRWKNEYNTLKAKLEKEEENKQNLILDDFTDYIEHTFKYTIGSIDVKKISTLKAFNNYYKAIKQNKVNANT